MGTGDGLDVLVKKSVSCFCQDSNSRSSSVYASHCTDYAAAY